MAGPAACGGCGTTLPAGARFCPACGVRVADAPAAGAPIASPPSRGERRPVAILFADLAGFTRLTSEADAEEVHRLLGRFFEVVDGIVARSGGTIDKHIGDATMAVFGAPVAHGNDVERAVRAACDIHDAMAGLSSEFGRTLATHIGIASGEVVAASTGSAVRADYTMTGDAVNLASRLEELAGTGETIVSDEVREALGARLEVESRGTLAVRGFAREMNVWRVLALRAPDSAQHRLVGRIAERERFDAALARVHADGRGSTLLLRGDPGVGKSALSEAMLRAASVADCECHVATVLDFGATRGRDAAGMLARSLLGLAGDADASACRAALDDAVAVGRVRADDEPFVADLLSLPQRAAGAYDAMDPAARGRGRVAALVALIAGAARARPVAVLVEDLHWADPALLDAIEALRDRARELPLLLLLTTRRDGDPVGARWPDGSFVRLDLAPLSTDESLELARSYLGARPEVARRCVERAQGNPLFLTQLIQSGADGDAVPGSIRNVVLARLDRLPADEKQALQAAAVIGQRFDPALVAHLTGGGSPALSTAHARDLVRDAGAGEIAFTHALIRDGAYSSLLHSARRDMHGRAAAWYAGRDPALRAEHLERAEDPLAPQAFLEAANAAEAALHHDAALMLAQRGARLAPAGPVAYALATKSGSLAHDLGRAPAAVGSWERAVGLAADERERSLAQIGVASAHRLTSAATPAMAALDAAQPVAERLGMTRELARIAYLRGCLHFARGDIDACAAEHERALSHARASGDETCEAQALSGIADALYASGRMASARIAFRRCVSFCERRGDVRGTLMNRLMGGIIDFYLGDLPSALGTFGRVEAIAREIGHRVAEVMAGEAAGVALVGAGRDVEGEAALRRSLALAREIASRRFAAFDLALLGRLARRAGDVELAREQLAESWALLEDAGPGLAGPLVLAAQARIAGTPSERRALLDRGEALLRAGSISHNHFWFREDAIDASLDAGEFDEALRHAAELERYVSSEPVPWAAFMVARVRALVSARRGNPDVRALTALRDRAIELDLRAAVPAIDEALATASR